MITAETVNRILSFHGNGLPVVSLYGRIDPGCEPEGGACPDDEPA